MATTLERPRSSDILETQIRSVPPSFADQPPKTASDRLVSLDAYRGFIMLMLCSHGFGFPELEGHPTYGWIANQFEHVAWEGMVFWDLIQPAFMFMVGAAMPFAFAARIRRTGGEEGVLNHVAWRAFMLIVLSQVFISIGAGKLSFQLINVLAQISFAYMICYWIMKLPFRAQVFTAGLILAGHWALFAMFPGSEGAFSKADNIGARIDRFFGLEYRGYYVTINFISESVTTLFGVWTGYLMIEKHSHAHRMKVLAMAAAACFAGGYALSIFNPMVKRLWTASFTFASTGWVLLMLMFFYWLIEMRGHQKLAFPLVVIGMNSIFIYGLHMILTGWLDRAVGVFTLNYEFIGTLAPVAQMTTVVAVMWYLCYWLYQRRIFLKI